MLGQKAAKPNTFIQPGIGSSGERKRAYSFIKAFQISKIITPDIKVGRSQGSSELLFYELFQVNNCLLNSWIKQDLSVLGGRILRKYFKCSLILNYWGRFHAREILAKVCIYVNIYFTIITLPTILSLLGFP